MLDYIRSEILTTAFPTFFTFCGRTPYLHLMSGSTCHPFFQSVEFLWSVSKMQSQPSEFIISSFSRTTPNGNIISFTVTEPLEAPTKANSKIEELLQKFLAKGERPPSYTEAMIKNKLKKDILITGNSLKISLSCPLAKIRIQVSFISWQVFRFTKIYLLLRVPELS